MFALVGGLDRVDGDGTVEERRREDFGVARVPVDLEGPVVRDGKLADEFGCLRVPA